MNTPHATRLNPPRPSRTLTRFSPAFSEHPLAPYPLSTPADDSTGRPSARRCVQTVNL
ncbi:hypothetical protein WKI65_37425 [Streptomyces sp. MS1.AVA.3]|uniref:hypothetical protein n=1 Tax=Streptomyces decoyicus TaxID=249567 RepID=UPI0030C27829